MDNNEEKFEETTGIIQPVEIDKEMRTAYIDYSMSVIVSRALPDVRDGMKPVQRRVIYGMDKMGLGFTAQTRKSARIVGDVMGKYHPHGDSSVYDAMVRLGQKWNQRYPLVFGQGNFGSMDGDPVAAMRYTEAKLQKMAEDVIGDIDKDTVDMVPNFDDTEKEPVVLPTKAPLLLLNGSAGIAVGMATSMPPHNLTECCNAIAAYIDAPDISTDGLMQHIKGPDFPTGGIIMGTSGIREAYETGRGRVVIRSRTEIEVDDKGRETIVVTEIPYMVNKREMIEKIAQMVEDKKIEGISYINDESSAREGVRVIIRLKMGVNSNVVLNTLYKYTPLQSSFSFNNVALVKGRPRTLSLKEIIANFVDFRHEVVVRRTRFELDKAKKRAHILEGLLKAIDVIDRIVYIIRHSAGVDEAKQALMDEFGFTDPQATAIVEMRLRQLTGLEREKLQAEYDDLVKFIAKCEEILASPALQLGIVKEETLALRDKYGDDRLTEITLAEDEFNPEDFYADEEQVITISHLGYIKRTPLTEFRTQHRGGVGLKGSATRDEDFIEHIYIASTHATMLLFTQKGRCYWLKVYMIPEGNRTSKGRAIQNILSIDPDDKVKAYINVRDLKTPEFIDNHYILMITKNGTIKKTSLEAYSRPRTNGINAINIREDDELIEAMLTSGKCHIMIAAHGGRCVHFEESQARAMGRTSTGVRGINLDEGDFVVGAVCLDPEEENAAANQVLVVSENGFGKRSDPAEYRQTSRGAKGVKTINITEKTGPLVALKSITDEDDLMIITRSGLTIRMEAATIRVTGRAAQGVKLINIREGDSIAAVSVVRKGEEDEEEAAAPEAQENIETTE
ncbi:MAG: DNA gyrase subunit A [Bacteroidales bacterium]|nr:DNA gyrase subunit A [Bacteroidales bacterium]